MELKNAVAVCLISLFSATLVVLIARSLDSQAASRLEPQLIRIADELETLRKQGGVATAPGDSTISETIDDGLIVYYFHGKQRCPTCQSIESQAHDTVTKDFDEQLKSGKIVWKIANFEELASKSLTEKFEIQMSVVVLAKMKDGRIEDWKRLDEVWPLVIAGDKPAFSKYVREEIEKMLAPDKQPAATTGQTKGPAIPTPSVENSPSKKTPAIPIP